MIFKGNYIQGKFVPSRLERNRYLDFIKKVEDSQIDIQIEIKKPESYSSKQVALLDVLIDKVVDVTGSNHKEVLSSLDHLRLIDDFDYKNFGSYNTLEMMKFIDESIIYLNSFFNLGIEIQTEANGKAKIVFNER